MGHLPLEIGPKGTCLIQQLITIAALKPDLVGGDEQHGRMKAFVINCMSPTPAARAVVDHPTHFPRQPLTQARRIAVNIAKLPESSLRKDKLRKADHKLLESLVFLTKRFSIRCFRVILGNVRGCASHGRLAAFWRTALPTRLQGLSESRVWGQSSMSCCAQDIGRRAQAARTFADGDAVAHVFLSRLQCHRSDGWPFNRLVPPDARNRRGFQRGPFQEKQE